jgi:molybdopterin-guanine dinucleotide biosynthesis protein A
VVVLATDLPLVGALPSALVEALFGVDPTLGSDVDTTAALDALLAADASGRPQQLCAAYRADALRCAIADNGPPHGAAMRAVVERLRASTLSIIALSERSGGETRGGTAEVDPTWDIDTPEDLHRLEALLIEPTEPTDP